MRTRLFQMSFITTTIFAAVLLVGCRGLRPIPKLIQVTNDADAVVPEIQPLEQRLATNKKQQDSLASEVIRRSVPDSPEARIAAQAERVKLRRNELMGLPSTDNSKEKKATEAGSKPVSISLNDALAATEQTPNKAASGLQISLNDTTIDAATVKDTSTPKASDAETKTASLAPVDVSSTGAAQTTQTPLVAELAPSVQDSTAKLEKEDVTPATPRQTTQAKSQETQLSPEDFGDLQQVHVADVQLPNTKSADASSAIAQDSVATAKPNTTPKQPTVQLSSLLANRKTEPGSLPVLQLPSAIGPVVQASGTDDSPDNKVEKAANDSIQPTQPAKLTASPKATDIQRAYALRSSTAPNGSDLPLPPLALALPENNNAMDLQSTGVVGAALSMPVTPQPESKPNSPNSPIAMPVQPVAATQLKTDPAFVSDEELYKVLINRLSTPDIGESEAAKSRRLIMLRYLSVLAGKLPEDQSIEGLNEQERKYLQHQLSGLRTMIDPSGHPASGRRLSAALPDIREASKYLAAATDTLEVRSLSFCTEIEAYGQVKTFPGNRFQRGQQVILYCEVENFVVNNVKDGFETHLKGSYEIYDAANEKLLSQTLPPDVQVSSNYIRDYFVAYQMHLPKQLTAGTYRLQLTMEDVNGEKYGQASIPLEIAE